jgi:hypothetical protein
MVGLTLAEGEGAAKSRGLAVHRENSIQSSGTGVVVSQSPAPGSVAEKGTAVNIVLETVATPNLLTLSVSPARVICGAGAVVRLQLRLSERATVGAQLVTGRRTVQRTKLGRLNAGTSNVRVTLPRHLARGTYKLALDATAGARTAHTVVDVKAGVRRACSAY